MGMEAEKPETYLGSAARHLSQGEVAAALATIAQGLARHHHPGGAGFPGPD